MGYLVIASGSNPKVRRSKSLSKCHDPRYPGPHDYVFLKTKDLCQEMSGRPLIRSLGVMPGITEVISGAVMSGSKEHESFSSSPGIAVK